MLDQCGDIRVVQAMLGHARLDTTERYVRRVDLAAMRVAMEGRSPPPQPEKSKGGCLKIGLIVLGVLVLLAIVGAALSGGGDEGGDEASEDGGDTGQQDRFPVGATAPTGDLEVTVNGVQNPLPPGEFDQVTPGQHFVAVEVTLVNTSTEPLTLSTFFGTELTDSLGRPATIALARLDLPRLDGVVEAGGMRRAFVVFSVPDDAVGLELRVRGSLTANGAVFTLG